MGGAIYNPQLNPQASYAQYTGDNDAASYNQQAANYDWTGTTWKKKAVAGAGGGWVDPLSGSSAASGTPSTEYGGYPAGGGVGAASGSGVAGSASSFWSTGGAGPGFDARKALWRQDMQTLRDETHERGNDDSARRGVYASGVGADLWSREESKLNRQESAGLESMSEDYWRQTTAFDLEQKRMDADAKRSQMAGVYSQDNTGYRSPSQNSNENQRAMEYAGYSEKASGGSNAYSTGASTGGYHAPAGPSQKSTGEPYRQTGESYESFSQRWNSWYKMKQAAGGYS